MLGSPVVRPHGLLDLPLNALGWCHSAPCNRRLRSAVYVGRARRRPEATRRVYPRTIRACPTPASVASARYLFYEVRAANHGEGDFQAPSKAQRTDEKEDI